MSRFSQLKQRASTRAVNAQGTETAQAQQLVQGASATLPVEELYGEPAPQQQEQEVAQQPSPQRPLPDAPAAQSPSQGTSAVDIASLADRIALGGGTATQAGVSEVVATPQYVGSESATGEFGAYPRIDPANPNYPARYQELTSEQKRQALAEETDRTSTPLWLDVNDSLADAAAIDREKRSGTSYDALNADLAADSQFANSLDHVSYDEPSIDVDASYDEPFVFDSQASLIGHGIQQMATQSKDFGVIAKKAGLIDPEGRVDPEAARQMYFATQMHLQRRGFLQDQEADSIAREFKDAEKQGVVETRKDRQGRNAIQRRQDRLEALDQRPDFNNKDSAGSIYKDYQTFRNPPLEGIGSGTRVQDTANTLTQDEQNFLMDSMLGKMASDTGLLDASEYKDIDGYKRIGYKPTDAMLSAKSGIQEQLTLMGLANQKDIIVGTTAPRGLSPTDSSKLHSRGGKSVHKIDLDKVVDRDNMAVVSEALDYMGTNGNIVNDNALSFQTAQLNSVFTQLDWMSRPEPYKAAGIAPLGISTSPFASSFLMDSQTFFESLPKPHNWDTFEMFQQEYKVLADKAVAIKTQGIQGPQATALLNQYNDFVEQFVKPARDLQKAKSSRYIHDVFAGMRNRGQVFNYAMKMQPLTGRMDEDSNFSMQKSKKLRGMITGFFKKPTLGITLKDIKNNPTGRPPSRIQRNIEAMFARVLDPHATENLSTTNDMQQYFRQNIDQWAEAAQYLYDTTPDTNAMKEYYSAVDAFVANKQIEGYSKKAIRPDNFEMKDFPKPPIAAPAPNSNWTRPVRDTAYARLSGATQDTGKTHQQMQQKVAEIVGFIKTQDGVPVARGKQDEGDMMLSALYDLGKYLSGTTFTPSMVAERDAKNSSFAITGMQMGNSELLSHAGVLYDLDKIITWDEATGEPYYQPAKTEGNGGNVVPLGNIRSLLQRTINPLPGQSSVLDIANLGSPVEVNNWRKAYAFLVKSGYIDKLHKKPAMTSSYGKAATGHRAHIQSTMESDPALFRKFVEDHLKLPFNETTKKDVVDKMTTVEALAINEGLGEAIQQTNVMKMVGAAGAVAGVNVVMRSPSGYPINMAGGTSVVLGKVERQSPLDGSIISSEIRTSVADPRKRKTEDKYADQSHKNPYTPDKETALVMENRVGVLSIHGVDAAIMHYVAARVKELNKTRDTPLWFRQVYDALVLDADSFDIITDLYNEAFININRKYNIFGESFNALRRVQQEVLAKAKKSVDVPAFDVSPTGEYKDLFKQLKELDKVISGTERKDVSPFKWSRDDKKRFRTQLANLDFDNENGKLMTGKQFHDAFALYLQAKQVEYALKHYENKSNVAKQTIVKEIFAQSRQMFGNSADISSSVKQVN